MIRRIDDAKLRELSAKGMFDKEMAVELGANVTSVGRRRRVLGIPDPHLTRALLAVRTPLPKGFKWPFTLDQFRECSRLSISHVEIAGRLGLTLNIVKWRLRRVKDEKAERNKSALAIVPVKVMPDPFRDWPVLVDDVAASVLAAEDRSPAYRIDPDAVRRPRNWAERHDPPHRRLVIA